MTESQIIPQIPDEDLVWGEIYDHCVAGNGASGFDLFHRYVEAKMGEAALAARAEVIRSFEEKLCQIKQ